MKFAHIADTHIRNLKYHKEYKEVFSKIYENLRKEKVDYIIHCGDICHTKTQISPEYVSMASDFLFNLAEIAPTYVILGNHDGNLRNGNREDSISPIVKNLDHKNLHLLKDSGETILDDKFALNVLSVFDADNWKEPSDKNKINIALYHGSVSGCQTDLGWTMDIGEHDISIFDKFDYAMLGDIHLTNQILDKAGKIRYAGSTIQQNHGETTDKGFLLWDIKDKNDFVCEPVVFTNPKPFISIPLTKTGKIPKSTKVPTGARLRLVIQNSVSSTAVKKAVDVAKKLFSPESLTIVNKATFNNNLQFSDNFKKENLRDLAVQEKLIKTYLEDYNITKDLEKKITDLNKKYKEIVEADDVTYRNVDFEVLELQWSNLFNYGEDNKIDFTKYAGITGIYGKNFSGKSSIIDSLLFTIYNSISKNSRKNLNIVNNDKENGFGSVKIRRGNKIYSITRTTEKYLKKLKGQETVEAKTNVEFSCYDSVTDEVKSLNGLTRADTDRNIVKYFGTIEDFLITSMSSQLGAFTFINEGSTKRKEILAKFLDLEIFDKKFKTAKDDVADIKSAIKNLETVNYDEEIKKCKDDLIANEASTMKRKNSCKSIKKEIDKVQEEILGLDKKISSAPSEIIDIVDIRNKINKCEQDLLKNEKEVKTKEEQIQANNNKIIKANSFIQSFDKDSLEKKKQQYDEMQSELDTVLGLFENNSSKLTNIKKRLALLDEVPCGSEYSHCKFIRDAYEAQNNLPIVQKESNRCESIITGLRTRIGNLNISNIDTELSKFDNLISLKEGLEKSIPTDNLLLENLKSKISISKLELKELKESEKYYEDNKEVIEDLENIMNSLEAKKQLVSNRKKELEECETNLLDLYKSHGYYEQKLENLNTEKQKLSNLQTDYEAHDLYMRCMHPNGIAYDIIKKSLPTINSEIAKVLANVVDFNVFFETDDKRLDIYIQHPNLDPSPLEMASGAEKTVAAMAIRLAFTNISSLPKSQLFILDEPGTALDADRMEGFVRILEIVTSSFKNVILISHLESLKESAESIITIEKKNGYANVWA